MKKEKNMMHFLQSFFPEEMTSGEVIKAKRKNFGFTLEEISEVTGIDIGNLSAIENDKKPIGLKTAIKIGLSIGLHPSSILFPNGSNLKVSGELILIKKKAQDLFDKKKIKMAI
jgi:transcriptional regulator with XRE-family HTH domain